VNVKKLQIFRPGRHTAASGATLVFSESDLQATARAYDPAKHEAPIVVGHPTHDAPAYGWVKSLGFGEELEAEPHQVDPAFGEMVSAGRFKKISASFYKPDAPNNPVPGVYYLRHVGFLGAQPPAVKGLRNPEFADNEAGVIEFADWGDMQNASLWRRLRDWFIADKGLDAADKIIPDYAVASLEDAARTEPNDAGNAGDASAAPAAFSEQSAKPTQGTSMTPEQIALQKKLDEQAAAQARKDLDFAEREKRLAAEETARRRVAIVGFADQLVTQGKLLPAEKLGLVEFMSAIAPESVIEFGEGETKTKAPAGDWLKTFLGNLPKRVEFGEIGKKGVAGDGDLPPELIAQKAVEFQEAEGKAGRTINIAQAVAHVTAPAKK